ncbi:MAG: hypothetical protein LQ346_005093 [Caloplaca aetnensis]|nr:MAG: hypothetical protein LQ346_005093 [Caloplaca aetnensis]
MANNTKNFKAKTSSQLQSLQNDAQCWHKIKVFLFDLRHFKERTDSRDRLELITDPSYIAAPYFEPPEIQSIKSFIPGGCDITLGQLIESTLDEKLNRRMKKRVATADYRVCAAHDLAPVFEQAFGVRPKDLQKDKMFVKSLTADGLILRQS